MDLVEFIKIIDEWGVRESLLPFCLIFTVVFAILSKTNILGREKKGLNAIIALVLGLLTVIVHISGQLPDDRDPVIIMNNAIPNIMLVFIAVFALTLLVGVFGGTPKTHQGAIFAFVVIFAIMFNFFFNNQFPSIAPVILALTAFFAIIYAFSSKRSPYLVPGWIFILAFVAVFYFFMQAAGFDYTPAWLQFFEETEYQALIIILVVAGIIIAFITRSEK